MEDIDGLKKDEVQQVDEENGKFIFAGVMILVGAALLISMLTGYTIDNWWVIVA